MLHRILWAGALASLAVSTPLAAQQRSVGPSFGITPYAGYMKFGNLVSGPLGTSVRNAGAAVYGAEATLGLTRAIALVGNVAYTQPGLEIGAPLIGGVSVGQSSVLLYDAALRLRVPVGMGGLPISPFVQGGAGYARQSFDVGPASHPLDQLRLQRRRRRRRGARSPLRPPIDGQGLHREVRCAGGDGAERRHQDERTTSR